MSIRNDFLALALLAASCVLAPQCRDPSRQHVPFMSESSSAGSGAQTRVLDLKGTVRSCFDVPKVERLLLILDMYI